MHILHGCGFIHEIFCFLEQEGGLKDILQSRPSPQVLSLSLILFRREGNHRTHKRGSQFLAAHWNPSRDSCRVTSEEIQWATRFLHCSILGSISVYFLIPTWLGFPLRKKALPSWSHRALLCGLSLPGTGKAGDPQGLPHLRKTKVNCRGQRYSKYFGVNHSFLSPRLVDSRTAGISLLLKSCSPREKEGRCQEGHFVCSDSRLWVCLWRKKGPLLSSLGQWDLAWGVELKTQVVLFCDFIFCRHLTFQNLWRREMKAGQTLGQMFQRLLPQTFLFLAGILKVI